jgi:selenocysteine-specific elongation factor
MTSRGAFKLYAGSAERDARVRLYDVGELPEGGAFARIRLSAPAVLEVGDRFVLRESGRRETVAGGVVLDPYPPGRPRRGAGDRLTARERADRSELPTLLVAERGAVRVDDVALLVGSRPEVVPGAVRVGAWWVAGALLESVRRALATRLTRFHASAPHVTGLSLSALRPAVVRELRAAGAPADVELASGVIEGLVAQGLLEREHEFVRLASHKAEVPAATREVVEAVRSGGPTPPTLPELLTAGFGRDLIESAVRSGELVRVSAEIVLTPGFVDRALEAVREAGERGITVSALRERLGTTRRYAVPLMEYLDRTGATLRAGDLRFARTRP